MTAKRVLCVSFDGAASDTRCDALRRAGHAVTPALKVSDAMELLKSESFDLIIIGHRFSSEEKRGLASTAREEGTPVLLVNGMSPDKAVPADARVYPVEGTAAIVKAAESLLSKQEHEPPPVSGVKEQIRYRA